MKRAELLAICYAVLVLLFPSAGHASRQTVEAASLNQIAFAVHLHEVTLGDATVTNWIELRKVIDVDRLNQDMAGKPGCPLEKHYVFVPGELKMPSYFGDPTPTARLIAAAPLWRDG